MKLFHVVGISRNFSAEIFFFVDNGDVRKTLFSNKQKKGRNIRWPSLIQSFIKAPPLTLLLLLRKWIPSRKIVVSFHVKKSQYIISSANKTKQTKKLQKKKFRFDILIFVQTSYCRYIISTLFSRDFAVKTENTKK